MDIGLYQQFDLHPEKVMYEKTGTSGIRFFLLDTKFWQNNRRECLA